MAAEENTTYQEIYDPFIWDRPTHFNFANDVIDKWASKDKKKPAIFWVDDKAMRNHARSQTSPHTLRKSATR